MRLIALIAAMFLSACSTVPMADQRADAQLQCADKGSALEGMAFESGGRGSAFKCRNGEFVSVTNLRIGD